jgi:hypothetical protein
VSDKKIVMEDLNWPILREDHDQALKEAVNFILDQFKVQGILVSGEIIQGQPRKSSRFIMYAIIKSGIAEKLIHKRFSHVPVEITICSFTFLRDRVFSESHKGIMKAASLLTKGFILFDTDLTICELQGIALEVLNTPLAYIASDKVDDLQVSAISKYKQALTIPHTDIASLKMLLELAVYEMLQYRFLNAGLYIPNDMDIINELNNIDPKLGKLTRNFFNPENNIQQMLSSAEEIIQSIEIEKQ